LGSGSFVLWAGWFSGGLVVAGGVQDEFAQKLAGGGGDHADVQVFDEHDHVGSGVGSSDADVVEPTVVADGDGAGVVDTVVADAGVGVGVAAAGGQCLGPGGVDGRWGGAVWQGPVRALVVVGVGEAVDQGLQVGDGGRLGGLGA
jgi:hypothetical protein